tara:strand:- start:1168 stop:2550 length:1383 start_codon:yes stop_codon:yes gene_type:complete
MPTILGSNSDSGYEISNSLRFNDGSSEQLSITPGSAGNRRTFTWSGWVKKTHNTVNADPYPNLTLLFAEAGGNTNNGLAFLPDGNTLRFFGQTSSSDNFNLTTTRLFRDPSAWYHIVVAMDTTQSTASNRLRIYVNGTELTAFNTENNPDQNLETSVNNTVAHYIGGANQSNSYFDGYLAEIHFIDGAQKVPTDFGESDDNGTWIPKKYTGGSYGTNGFFLEFKQTGTSQNSSGIGADTSGQDNHLAVTNLTAIDVTTDTPTNNFATLNPLAPGGSVVYSDASLRATAGANAQRSLIGTIVVSSGKWYWETKWNTVGSNDAAAVGIQDVDNLNVDGNITGQTNAFVYLQDGRKQNDSAVSSYGTRFVNGDIIGTALNLDDGTITFYLNGSSQGVAFSSLPSLDYYLAAGFYNNNDNFDINFGNPGFAISSGNNDGKYGNFEYAPPAGYYAVCTKRLAQFG